MAKIINTYGSNRTLAEIKTSADVPLQADMVIVGNEIQCSNLAVTQIKNVLGESTTSVGGLCTSLLVNKWSGFSPWEFYINGTIISNRIRTPYMLGSYAGYNHQATTPAASPSVWNVSQTIGANLNLTPTIYLGEIAWKSLSLTEITGVLCEVYNGSTVIASQAAAFNNPLVFDGVAAYFDLLFANTSSSLTIKYQFVRMTEQGYAKTFLIPNIVNTPVNITMITGGGGDISPKINDITLAVGVYNEYPTAMLLYGDAAGNNISGSYINFTIKGIDTDNDGLGDVTGVTFPVYASKNGGAKILIGTIRPARANTVGFSAQYPGGFVNYDTVVITIGD